MKGYVHIYCGDGKGKTSAAVGLAVRAAGRGLRVLIVRFLKTEDSGEVPAMRRIPGICVVPCEKSFGFTFQMSEAQKREASEYYRKRLSDACIQALSGQWDLLILDEILGAVGSGLVPEEQLTEFLRCRPESLEVVLTGRNPSARLVELADYVSEIRAVKHPFERGVGAREGIEY
ncbi:MAG: cob(I)yrinic acid a,c-diamide adenosyltransferase [Eubacteriales bacterium]|nr:cob(I)yrinic acid a,c-diamide adenosyltransferase [Eubacteriales bacterium]